jgi:polyhydroxybutyrate depolymerase
MPTLPPRGLIRLLAVLAFMLGAACDVQPGCGNLAPGDFSCTIDDGRTYLLHVPASYDGTKPVPLVLDMHGFTSTAGAQRAISGWLQESDLRGFVVAFPQGIGNAWKAQGQCCVFNGGMQDDVQFLSDIALKTTLSGNIDTQRIYATGLSNGGSMAHTLACKASNLFRAVAPVSFALSGGATVDAIVAGCTQERPIPVIHFHGTADTVSPYADGALDSIGAQESLATWARIERCNAENFDFPFTSNVLCETHVGCANNSFVTLCTVTDGQHVLYPSVTPSGRTIASIAFDLFDFMPMP